jgi:hypothetical protein
MGAYTHEPARVQHLMDRRTDTEMIAIRFCSLKCACRNSELCEISGMRTIYIKSDRKNGL